MSGPTAGCTSEVQAGQLTAGPADRRASWGVSASGRPVAHSVSRPGPRALLPWLEQVSSGCHHTHTPDQQEGPSSCDAPLAPSAENAEDGAHAEAAP